MSHSTASRPRGAVTALLVIVVAALATVAARQQDAVAHPERWPAARSPAVLADPATEARVSELLAGLTVEEKVGQVIQADLTAVKPDDLRQYPLGSVQAGGNSSPDGDERTPARVWVEAMRRFRAANTAYWGARPVIPIMFGIDAVHGHANIVGATIFPHNVGLGAMRDPGLVRRIGEVTATEMAATGADWTYAPTVTVPRDDRWGRGYEGWSEDPEIVAAYARAITLGLQGELGAGPIAPGRIAGTAKHFLADGGTDGGKDQGDARISEDDLVRIHAAGYKPAIDAGILTVMMSFSSWNGVKHTGNRSLITDVLKGRMGFSGLVINDWNSHGQVPGCTNDNCPQAINAGVDMYMVPSDWKGLFTNLVRQVKDGTVPMARLDDAVRRILRVKIKAGVFRGERPLEGKLELLGAPAHRAVARDAVRKSLVLLKNDGVLPIRGNARVLVAGDADDIGKACGGWTLSWQGTGNTNADFPGGQSILAGFTDALGAQGGSVTYSADGRFTTRPDVAVVVFGEEPYAEFQGDLATMHYKPGDDRDLSMLRALKAQGIPTVAVFLSGRPLWVNREINASDAFVAAWLPGTEGGGIADVLVADATGRPRFDFTGALARTWPKRPDQATLNRGDAGADPLFAYGYGLSYARPGRVESLPEDGAVSESTAGDVFFGAGRMQGGARAILRDPAGERHVPAEGTTESPGRVIVMRPLDVGAQENAREVVWSGAGAGTLEFTGITRDLTRQANGDMAIALTWGVDEAPTAAVTLGMGCGDGCLGRVDVTAALRAVPSGQLRTLKVKLSCLAAQGTVMRRVDRPLVLETTGRLRLVLRDVRLVTNEGDANCPGPAQ